MNSTCRPAAKLSPATFDRRSSAAERAAAPVRTLDLIPTRQSLLSRLRDWNDAESWEQFFNTYWRLIYEVALKAGLNEAEAQDVVQETVISVAKQMPDFHYDSTRGKFKGYLLQITRRRIADLVRKRLQANGATGRVPVEMLGEEHLQTVANSGPNHLEAIWESEWERHLFDSAVARVKQQVRPEHYQLFDLYALQKWPLRKITQMLGVNAGQVYLAKHRVGALLKKEIKILETKGL